MKGYPQVSSQSLLKVLQPNISKQWELTALNRQGTQQKPNHNNSAWHAGKYRGHKLH